MDYERIFGSIEVDPQQGCIVALHFPRRGSPKKWAGSWFSRRKMFQIFVPFGILGEGGMKGMERCTRNTWMAVSCLPLAR